MKPASFSTQDPPHAIESLELREYVLELRRRIEVLNFQIESLVQELRTAREKSTTLR